MKEDSTLDRLLLLHGEIMDVGGGFRIKIEAVRVPASNDRPHGVNYSLCLFTPENERIVCFDNAHTIAIGTGPARRKTEVKDHVHLGRRMQPYAYRNAESLLVDFWQAVDDVLKARDVT